MTSVRFRALTVATMVPVATFALAWAAPLGAQQSVAASAPETARDTRAAEEMLKRVIDVHIERATLSQAIDSIAARAGATVVYRHDLTSKYAAPINVNAKQASLGGVLQRILSGTTLKVLPAEDARIVIVETANVASRTLTGVVTGRITDSKTKLPIAGATVLLDASNKGVRTDADGVFRLTGIAAGEHTLSVRYVGYTKQIRRVKAVDDATAQVDIELEQSRSQLDQVVVTGTVVATELKAVPNAITVITAKQLQERGVTRIDQLFRGDIPGLFSMAPASDAALDEMTMFSRGATTLGESVGSDRWTNPIKTYVDGIEIANASYITQMDPGSIERIEILSGPQASTIYGSNAINGVMQIFTKRGTSAKPQLTINLLSGWVENSFRPTLTPQHDHSAQLSGVESRLSYSAGGSWFYMGRWTPGKQTARTNAFTGARLALPTPAGGLTADFSYRWGNTRNWKAGSEEQSLVSARESGWRAVTARYSTDDAWVMNTLREQTVGTTIGFTPTSWWSSDIGLGYDATTRAYEQYKPQRTSVADSTLSYNNLQWEKRTLRFSSSARIPVTHLAQATLTVGGDARQEVAGVLGGSTGAGTINSAYGNSGWGYSRTPSHNTGGYLQTQLGVLDQLYFTYGLRAEWNPDFGSDALPSYAPRYGVAWTRDVGPVTTKLRASYGRATRPPNLFQKIADRSTDSSLIAAYGPFYQRIANPNLGPEHQQGAEGGLELYFGGRGSLVVTRFNQTVDGLITDVPGADSIRSLQPNPYFYDQYDCAYASQRLYFTVCNSQDEDGYGYAWQYQFMNVAGIRNQGWEVQGTYVMGPITARGTYSWTKSRSMGVTEEFKKLYASRLSWKKEFTPGATFEYLPEHTWSFGGTYARSATTVSMMITGVGQHTIADDRFFIDHLDGGIRLVTNRYRLGNFKYLDSNPGYVMADLNMSHRFQPHIEGVLSINNIANSYQFDFTARTATLGRQMKLGLRIRM